MQFKKSYPSVSHLTLDSKGLFPILLVSHVAVLLLYVGMETPSVWKAKISFWKPLPGTERVGNEAREAVAGASREVSGSNWESIKYLFLETDMGTVWDHVIIYMLVLNPSTSRFITSVKLGSS